MLCLQFGVIMVCIAASSTKDDHSEKPSLTYCTSQMYHCEDDMLSQAIGSEITCGSIKSFVECAFHSGCEVPASYLDKWQHSLQTIIENQGLSCTVTLDHLINPKTNSFEVTRSTSSVLLVATTIAVLLRSFLELH